MHIARAPLSQTFTLAMPWDWGWSFVAINAGIRYNVAKLLCISENADKYGRILQHCIFYMGLLQSSIPIPVHPKRGDAHSTEKCHPQAVQMYEDIMKMRDYGLMITIL